MKGLRATSSRRRWRAAALASMLLGSMFAAGATEAASVTVTMQYVVFSPTPLKIVVGTTVTWVNKDSNLHQVVSDTGAFPSSKLLKTGEKYSFKFSKAGTFDYHDGVYPTTKGTIIVTAAPKATPRPTPRPTPKPTPKPTAKPTVAPTPSPAVTPTAIAESTAGTPRPDSSGSGTPGGSPGSTGGGSGGSGTGSGLGSDGGSFDVGGIVIGFGLAVLAFLAGIGLRSIRRDQGGRGPGHGGPGGSGTTSGSFGPGGSGGSGAQGAAGTWDTSGMSGDPGDPGASAALDPVPDAAAVDGAATSYLSPAARRLVRRPAPLEPFDEDAPIGEG